MKVSIIIPVKNRIKPLENCLDSIKEQTEKPFEVIVSDDCSSIDLAPVCNKYGATHLRLTSPGGAAGARNTGAENANGEILFFIDSDVEITPEAVAEVQAYFEKNDHAAVVGSIIPETAGKNLSSQYFVLRKHFDYLLQRPPLAVIYGSIHAIRREVLESSGGFDTSFPEVEDAELGKRLASRGHFIGLSKTITGFHRHPMNLRTLLRNDFRRTGLHIKLLAKQKNVKSAIKQRQVASFRQGAIYSVITAPLTLFFTLLSFVFPLLSLAALALFVTTLALNWPFLSFAKNRLGLFRAMGFAGLVFLDMTAACLGAAWGVLAHLVLPNFSKEQKNVQRP